MKNLLVIDDDDTIRASIELFFENEFKVDTAENGLIGINKANSKLYDFIICDIDMPELNGYEVIEHIKNDDRYLTVPFIFLSAKSKEKQIIKGLKLGADEYLTKPFEFQTLNDVVKNKLNKREKLEKLVEERVTSFKSNISYSLPHEFLTPINGIIGPISMLTDNELKLDSDEINEMHSVIHNSAHRLKRTIENFLIYNELTIITIDDITLEKVDVSSILNEIYLECCESSKRNNDLVFESDFTLINFNKKYLKVILSEIINNAMKFSGLGDKIALEANTLENNYVISITDYGRGMLPEQLEQIGSFVQFDRKYYEQQGIGLGLGLIKKIVEIFELNLKIESKYNDFTKVTITFPSKYLTS
jgi:DNA-binding response OmpR family regulator/anti-sigma regulatory factor (Ser/Thr protein kinase)